MSSRAATTTARVHLAGRLLTTAYAVGTATAVVLTALVGRQVRPSSAELAFGLLNIPVSPTFLSVAILALVTGALVFRKRIGLWFVAGFQVFGVYLGVLRLIPHGPVPVIDAWDTRGDLGRRLDVASLLLGLAILGWLWRLRPEFGGRLRRGSWWLALLTLVAGVAITAGVGSGLLTLTRSAGADLPSLLATAVHALSGTAERHDESWVADVVATLLGFGVLVAAAVFLRSSRQRSEWTGDRELAIRGLLAADDADSLGYFATRRDKSSLLSADGLAAVTYRVIAGVSLASADPVGRRESWSSAIERWKTEAREFGWVPAVLSASETGALAYAAHGMRVIGLGDEAILRPDRFDLRRMSLTPVRLAARRAARAGLSVRIRRQAEVPADELAEIAACADAWRGEEPDRGFSMALNRPGDPADARILHVSAHTADGALAGVLSFVPWGRHGVSLDVMRRSPQAPNGVTELMVSELLTRAAEHGVRRVSLNFCMFRRVYADAERIGSGAFTRAGYSVLGVLDRFWQLERLYRSNQKYEPEWVPRFLCYQDAVSLPQVAVAAGAAEGFLPWPQPRASHRLAPEELRRAHEVDSTPADSARLAVRRSEQSRTRLARMARLREAGVDPYPAGTGEPRTTLAHLLTHWSDGEAVEVTGRVRGVRDLGAVVFADLRDGLAEVQLLLDAGRIGQDALDCFTGRIDDGDIVRIEGRLGASRNGTPSLLVDSWQVQATCLHPLPWQSFSDGEARSRARATDLIVHPEGIELLRHRSAMVAALRARLAHAGFLEVETPILQSVHGGASARPFRTFSNAYGVDLSLRIAPELYLKRLLVAGMGPIYELGRSFRNEGADATHNPEFTSLEVYEPDGDYLTMRRLAEDLVKAAASAVHGGEVMPAPTPAQTRAGLAGVEFVDISKPWPIVPVLAAVSGAVGRDVDLDTDPDVLLALARRHQVPVRPEMGPGALIEGLYAELVEPATRRPTFYVDFPVETSPLTRSHRVRPGLVERWDLVINGMEVGTAYSELTDPVEQRARLTAQSLKAAAGDAEAMELDHDFLHALELGMPPTGGLGIGIDRLAMLLTNTPIRSVLSFPFVRPRSSAREQ